MSRQIVFIVGLLFSIHLNAQTGIGTTTPNASAKLDVYSTNKGFLPPRVTLTSASLASPITLPAEGLLVYNIGSSGLQAGYYYWNGTSWATIATASSAGNGVASTNLFKLYQEGYSTTSGKAPSTNGYSFTVPVSGRYEFNFNSTGWNSNGSIIKLTFNVRNGTTVLATDYHESTNSNVWVECEGRVEVNLTAGVTYNVQVVTTTGNRDYRDFDKIFYKMVAGNLPVTGQSVDYVSAGSINLTGVGGSQDLIFSTNFGGNIPYNSTTGVFTLTANKTYLFQAQVRVNTASANGNYIEYGFVDAISNALLVNGTESITSSTTSTSNFGSNPVINFVYTPISNQTVKLRTTSGTRGTQSVVSGTANITQIGSSAIINPWTLSGTNTYNSTGNVGILNNSPTYTLDVTGTSRITNTPSITTATKVLVKDPTTLQISEQPISYITGIAKFINNTTQSTIAANTTVKLNTTTLNTISSYSSLNTSSGIITLQPGTYELNGSPGAGTAANGGGDSRCYPLFHNGTNYIGTGGVVESGPAGNYNTMPQNNANCVITVPAGQTATISLRLVVATNMGSISSPGDYGDVADAGRAWIVVRKYN
jgi:ethanolamine utilization microcompartment shell protein EutS